MITIKNFKNLSNGFNYVYEDEVENGETVLLKMPAVAPNKRGINDIGFMADDHLTIYATLSATPNINDEKEWQEIHPYDEINKTTSYLKIVNNFEGAGRVIIRVIMN
ncbi:MAG: hypothetical protein U0L72_08520 [Acutalibacteraceae bacterium]|nr:hypothetical protein [Acutalibacteraceae bacterium]